MVGSDLYHRYVNQANVPLWLAIQAGTPYYYAVMLDSTSFSSASWTAYTSSNLTVNLGSTQGWHTVWLGLCDMLGGAPCWNAVKGVTYSFGQILQAAWSVQNIFRFAYWRHRT